MREHDDLAFPGRPRKHGGEAGHLGRIHGLHRVVNDHEAKRRFGHRGTWKEQRQRKAVQLPLAHDAERRTVLAVHLDVEGEAALRFATETAASLIFPFAPHLGAEVYDRLRGERVWEQPWPQADPAYLSSDLDTYVVQVNGKLRDRIEVASDAPEEEVLRLARASEKVQARLNGKEVVKEIFVPRKLVNLVVR